VNSNGVVHTGYNFELLAKGDGDFGFSGTDGDLLVSFGSGLEARYTAAVDRNTRRSKNSPFWDTDVEIECFGGIDRVRDGRAEGVIGDGSDYGLLEMLIEWIFGYGNFTGNLIVVG
jgi:hypothetical protein